MNKRIFNVTIIMLLAFAHAANAQWNNDLDENTPVSPLISLPTLVPDGENGVIVFGQSRDMNPILRAQRISVAGRLLWPGLLGVRISDALHAQWIREFILGGRFVLPDGEGGGYIAYQVGRIVGSLPEVGDIHAISAFVQRLDSSGNRLFGADGLRLMPILPDTFQFTQQIMNMIPDGEGGVHVLWWVNGGDSTQFNGVYHNRIDKNGTPLWQIKKITDRFSYCYLPYLNGDLNLNLYEYPGETNPPGGRKDQFLKITKNSGNIISREQIEIGTGEYGFNSFYDFDQSNNGSAIFAFYDFRGDTLRVQKLDGNGDKLWGEEPVIVAKDLRRRLSFEVMSDGNAGAFMWYQTIDTVLNVIHLNGEGRISRLKQFEPERLGAFARRIASTFNRPMTVGPDGSVFILTDGFQRVTKILISGEVLWESRISNRAAIAANIDDYAAVADADGGCTVVWEEVGSYTGLRAQRVDRTGNLGGATPVEERPPSNIPEGFILEQPHPNPFNDTIQIAFSMPQTAVISLKVYNILGREVITLKKEKLLRGRHSILWDGKDKVGRKLPSGVYVLALRSGLISASQKILLLK